MRTNLEQGDLLPPEVELADSFDVNRHTVRRAIDQLVREGLVERFRGKGTVVLFQPIEYPISKESRYTQTMTAQGLTTSRIIIDSGLIVAPDGVARRLEIPFGSEVMWIEAIRLADGNRISASSQFVPHPYADMLSQKYEGGSVLRFLNTLCNVSLFRKYSLITAVLPEKVDVNNLGISPNLPLLRTKTIMSDTKFEKPVEYSVTRSRSDAVELRFDAT